MDSRIKPPGSASKGKERLIRENEELRVRLAEAEEALDAIRRGEVDAVLVHGPDGEKVYSLNSAEAPYRMVIEDLHQGAATLQSNGTILYCNKSFALFFGAEIEKVMGSEMALLLSEENREQFNLFLGQVVESQQASVMTVNLAQGGPVKYLQLNIGPTRAAALGDACVTVTDVTD